MNNQILISPIIKAAVSSTDLLKPKGKLQMFPSDFKNANFFEIEGALFVVDGDNFHFQLSVDATGLYAERNGARCVITPEMFPSRQLKCVVFTWSPHNLRLISNDGGKVVDLVEETIPCSVPISLKRWARDQNLIKTSIYRTESDFRDAVYQCISDLQSKIEDNGSGQSFWDFMYDGNKIQNKRPKKETMVQPLIKTIIDTELFVRGIDVFRENTTTTGDIDFTVVGSVAGIGVANMCIELKNAHSKYLENGLLNQLPNYMRSQNSQYGVYCVLNYNVEKGDNSDRAKLIQRLVELTLSSNEDLVRTKIRTFVIDLDQKIVEKKRKQ